MILAKRPSFDADQLVKKPLPPRVAYQARRALQSRETRASQLCNEQYDFKLTTGGVEVRAHMTTSVIDDHGRWPLHSSQHCRHDGQPFDGPPAAIPMRLEKGAWCTYGCFCSWSCATAFLEKQDISPTELARRRDLLQNLAYTYFGIAHVRPALPLEALSIFGGHLEIEEWRETAHQRHSTILYEPPLEPFDPIVLERMVDWESRRQHYQHYYGRNAEERKQKEQNRQAKLEQDMLLATSRENTRQRRQAASKHTLWQTMGITLVDES